MSPSSISELRDLVRVAEEEVLREWESADAQAVPDGVSADSAANTMLDRITQVGVSLVESGHLEGLELVVDTLVHLFRDAACEGRPSTGIVRRRSLRQALRWYEIATRVYVIGAVTVSTRAYAAIRGLVLQSSSESPRAPFWLRDTVTELARQQRFENQSLLGPVSEYASERPVFFRRFRNNKDELVAHLCRFDFLQCVVCLAERGDAHACYPNFGGFYKETTEPIIADLVTGGRSREVVVPDLTDAQLAGIIRRLDSLAASVFFRFAAWDEGDWEDQRVVQFLARHPPE